MDTVCIVTEADEYVATGHLMECIVCAKELIAEGYAISFWINNNAEHALKKRIPCVYHEYKQSIEEDNTLFFQSVKSEPVEVIIFNVRQITGKFLYRVKNVVSDSTKILCIDEFGHRNLPADIIINPMIAPYYWDYGECKARLYCGAEYLILPAEPGMLHLRKKRINEKIERIVISMGGADPENHTLKLVKIIPELFEETKIFVVIGAENKSRKEIEKEAAYKTVSLYRNVTNLPEMMFETDLLICAGGNTLHEAACIGTPAIVIPSRPHEEQTAKCFEEKGFGIVVNRQEDLYPQILNALYKISSLEARNEMSKNGKLVSDGLGRKRIVDIIKNRNCVLKGEEADNEDFVDGLEHL